MKKSNRLADEKSPYLLQHAYNPVNWYPWGEEAFEAARKEDRPVFLSIGYSTCHWCHVMERESFEDPEVASLLNDAFVCVKVDREERPDIDSYYMNVCQLMTGSGGWPLTVLLTPDRKPFFSGTYFPRESGYGRPGMLELVPKIKTIWETEREKVLATAGNLTSALNSELSKKSVSGELAGDIFQDAFRQLEGMFDGTNGGFAGRPKFPMPHYIMLLLRIWKHNKNEKALEMVETTLHGMAQGGIFDHLGGGFHRYSTDSRWVLPHFEKMLYDQAMMVMACTEAFLVTGKQLYRETAEQVLDYVLRDMTSHEGGFFSAEDADSEGVEGKFYLWTADELRALLPREEAEVINALYNVTVEGNFEDEATGERTGKNIFHMTGSPERVAAEMGMTVDRFQDVLHTAREKLFSERLKRVRPHLDDKVLTDWNGLMIAAFAKAAQAFGTERYHEAARGAADLILREMRTPSGGLLHRYRDGESAIEGYLDDYAFFIWGLMELYETGFDPKYLLEAVQLGRTALDHFRDDEGGFFLSHKDVVDIPVRSKIMYDGAYPSGNAVMMYDLLRLAHITGDEKYAEEAGKIERAVAEELKGAPAAHAMFLTALDLRVSQVFEIVLTGPSGAEGTRSMISALRNVFLPGKTVLFLSDEEPFAGIRAVSDFMRTFPLEPGPARAYICSGQTCGEPVADSDKMLRMLGF